MHDPRRSTVEEESLYECPDDDEDSNYSDATAPPVELTACQVRVQLTACFDADCWISNDSTWGGVSDYVVAKRRLNPNFDWSVCSKVQGYRTEPYMFHEYKVLPSLLKKETMENQLHQSVYYVFRVTLLPLDVKMDVSKMCCRIVYSQAAREYCSTLIYEDPRLMINCACAMLSFDTPRFGKIRGRLNAGKNIDALLTRRALQDSDMPRKWWAEQVQKEFENQPKRTTNEAMQHAYECFAQLRLFGKRTYKVTYVAELEENFHSIGDNILRECRQYWKEELGSDYSKFRNVTTINPHYDENVEEFVLAFDLESLTLHGLGSASQGSHFERKFVHSPRVIGDQVELWGANKNYLQLVILMRIPGEVKLIPMRLSFRVWEALEVAYFLNKYWRDAKFK